jgi:LacI family transcriptional regulator
MATIKDVARVAGVSISTVSAVVNRHPGTSEEVRRRVLAAIGELGYRRNGLARSLRTHRTQAIGLLVADITNPFFPDLARGVEDEARRLGFHVILCNTDEDPAREEAQVRLLLEQQVDGIVATAVRLDSRIGALIGSTPLVLVNRRIPTPSVDFVGIDNVVAARQAVEYLIALGHRRIAFIAGAECSTASDDRYTGYCDALAACGIPLDPGLVVRGYLRYAGGYNAARYFLTRPRRPTAVFAVDDLMALGAMQAFAEAGVRAGADVSLMGFDDIWVAAQPSVQLSTVRQPRQEMGVAAMRLLAERLRRPHGPPQRIILPHRLVIRQTCGGVASDLPASAMPYGEGT